MKISASIYSGANGKDLEQLVRELDKHDIDMFHVDCADEGEKVFEDIARIRTVSRTPIDLHIISPEPERYYAQIEKSAVEFVSFQYENLPALPQLPKSLKTRFGLSVSSATPVEVFDRAPDRFDFMMMMSTTPGRSGGVFNRESFRKIISFRHKYPSKRIHVDGGVNDQVVFILRLLGVHTVVSGSYLLNHDSLGAGMLRFHRSPDETHHEFKIGEFMTPLPYLPVLQGASHNIHTILQTIENYALGFVLITDATGKLTGVITNADVRRGLLRNADNMSQADASGWVNRHPVTINERATVADMARLLNELNFIVLFLPVVDDNQALKGAVLLHHLTRI